MTITAKKTKAEILFYLSLNGGWKGNVIISKDYDKESKFHNYMGTTLAYDMLCDPTCLDNEEEEGDNLSSNFIINLKILAKNGEKFLVCHHCVQ